MLQPGDEINPSPHFLPRYSLGMSHVTRPTDIIITLAPFLSLLSLSAPQSLYKVYPYTLLILFYHPIPTSPTLQSSLSICALPSLLFKNCCLSTTMYVLSLTACNFSVTNKPLAYLLLHDHGHGRQTRALVAA